MLAKDDLAARANEIASSALRDSMLEVRSQYEADRKALATEKELRLMAEEMVEKLKSDLALLTQATEYNDNVDLQVRKIAKKVSAMLTFVTEEPCSLDSCPTSLLSHRCQLKTHEKKGKKWRSSVWHWIS